MNEDATTMYPKDAVLTKEEDPNKYIAEIFDKMLKYFSPNPVDAKEGDPTLEFILSGIPKSGWEEWENVDEGTIVGIYGQEHERADGKREIEVLTFMQDMDIDYEYWLPDGAEDKEKMHPDEPINLVRNLTAREDTLEIETADGSIYKFLPKVTRAELNKNI